MDVSENEVFLNMAILIGNMMINHWICVRPYFQTNPTYPYIYIYQSIHMLNDLIQMVSKLLSGAG